MYPFKQYMKLLKKYVRNRNRSEGCIVECYTYEEAVEFCNEYLSNIKVIGLTKRVCTKETDGNDKISLGVVTDLLC